MSLRSTRLASVGAAVLVAALMGGSLAGCGGTGSASPEPTAGSAPSSTPTSTPVAEESPSVDPDTEFVAASRAIVLAGLRKAMKQTDLYMSDVNSRDGGSAMISAALVAIEYGTLRDKLLGMPEAGSTLGAATARVFSLCESRWSTIAKVVADDLPKATSAMEECTAALSDLTTMTNEFTK